ncbi:imelysin family protein [Rhizobium sp. RU20A]|uniref:imelysin family protein n=1 Tax=Rhizobium sp. RU20A TaxID=1907412 RepID=UPI00122CD5D8|nr:imelysin family protein [Rhizobium sp. RU20A]
MRTFTRGLSLALALALPLSLTAPAARAQDANPVSPGLNEAALPGVMEKAVTGFIRPGYAALTASTQALGTATQTLCASPSKDNLNAARKAFNDVVAKWSRVEILRVGPALEENRFERFLFFPDRKGLALKQLQAILSTKDKTALTAEGLKGKSVAIQGLGPLEYLLYGTGNETLATGDDFRCRYAMAIAANLGSIASEFEAAWKAPGGIGDAWMKPGANNPVFRTPQEAAGALLGVLVHGAETVQDQRIRVFFGGGATPISAEPNATGKDPIRDKPKSAPYWRSANTFPSIADNLQGLSDLFAISDMATLLPEGDASIAGSIAFVFRSATTAARAINAPVDAALADPDLRGKITFLELNTNDLVDRLNHDFGGAIGLGAGFSFADGD